MRKFLTYSALFVLLVTVVLTGAEALMRHCPNSYKYKHAWMQRNGEQVATLVLGGSHSYYGVDAALLGDSAFNLANVSQHPEYDYRLLRQYADRCPHLRRVILVVDAVNVFDPPIEQLDGDRERCTYYRLYMDCDKHSPLSRYGFEIAETDAYKRKFRTALKYLIKGEYKPECDSLGRFSSYDHLPATDTASLRQSSERAADRHRCRDYSQVDYNRSWLDSIGHYCRSRGIDIVVVTPPVWHDYSRLVAPRQRDEMHRTAQYMCGNYGARYYDLMDDRRFTAVHFHDGDHLSRAGATLFTRILNDTINEK